MTTDQTTTTGPGPLAITIACGILGSLAGYYIGQAYSIGLFSSSTTTKSGKKKQATSWPNSYDVKVHLDSSSEAEMDSASEEEDESEDEAGGEIGVFEGNEEVKLVLVVRTDLGMGKGKIAAQASHATLACYKHLASNPSPSSTTLLRRWERNGQAKIALQTKSEEELLTLQAQALSLGLCAQVIRDAGRTQIASGTRTVLGVLGPKSVVDGVTGGLKLL